MKSGAAGLRGKGCARGNRQQRRALGKRGRGAAREGFARGNRQQRRGRAYTSRRDVSGEVADLEIEGKGEGGWPAAPRILKRRRVAAAPIQRACSALQSHGSSPFSNRSASSSSSPTNLGGFPPLPLHPRAPGCSSASLPAPFPQLHRFLFLSSSFPLLSCFCLC